MEHLKILPKPRCSMSQAHNPLPSSKSSATYRITLCLHSSIVVKITSFHANAVCIWTDTMWNLKTHNKFSSMYIEVYFLKFWQNWYKFRENLRIRKDINFIYKNLKTITSSSIQTRFSGVVKVMHSIF
jgi:hypothetical protein